MNVTNLGVLLETTYYIFHQSKKTYSVSWWESSCMVYFFYLLNSTEHFLVIFPQIAIETTYVVHSLEIGGLYLME